MRRNIYLVNGNRIRRFYEQKCHPLLEEYGLTQNELDVLMFLANNQEFDTARQIVEYRGLTKSHVSRSVDRLCRRGFLWGDQDLADKRCVRLQILPDAGELIEKGRAVQEQFERELMRGVTQKEKATVARVFEKIALNVGAKDNS